jgi:hypothetical protein
MCADAHSMAVIFGELITVDCPMRETGSGGESR